MAEQDSIQGAPSAHMVVIAGYDNGKFLLLDPDFEFGGERWIDVDRLVGSIYLAETDF